MRTVKHVILVAALLHLAPSASGQVFSPWVNSQHTPDFRDPARFRQFSAWKQLQDQDLALAVWKYLTNPVTGTYHFTDMYELPGEPHWEVKLVQDPMKILNVYGFAVCTMHTAMTCGLYKGMGFSAVRLAGWEQYHATPEIFWGGDWHYIDIDERAYILDDKGNVASGAALLQHPEWWEPSSKKVTPFYPQNGGLKGVQTMAKHGPPYYAYNWDDGGYTPDFVRPGERVERFFQPQGYWRFADSYKNDSTRRIVSRDPRGPRSGGHSKHTYGNARFDYEPKIRSDFNDYAQGVWCDRNVRLGKDGLILAKDGYGSSTFYFQYPYIIVPQNGDLDDPDDDWDACVLRFNGHQQTSVKISADNGLNWRQVAGPSKIDETIPGNLSPDRHSTQTIDLTKYVAGKYAFWLRFEYVGKAGEPALQSLKVTAWTQLAPISLPRLKAGQNRMTYLTDDRYGLKTWTIPIAPECNDIEQLKPYLYGKYDYDGQRRHDRFRGPVTFKLDAPVGSQIEWLHISAGLWDSRGQGESRDSFEIAVDQPTDFQPVWHSDVPDWIEHWYFRGQKQVKLERPARTVYVRIIPRHGLLNVAFYLHVSKPGQAALQQAIAVTHNFQTSQANHSSNRELAKPDSYIVTCSGEPINTSVVFSVPHQKTVAALSEE